MRRSGKKKLSCGNNAPKRDFELDFKVFVQFILFYTTELYKTYILIFENKLIIVINQLIL
jgi:hypothetical protein